MTMRGMPKQQLSFTWCLLASLPKERNFCCQTSASCAELCFSLSNFCPNKHERSMMRNRKHEVVLKESCSQECTLKMHRNLEERRYVASVLQDLGVLSKHTSTQSLRHVTTNKPITSRGQGTLTTFLFASSSAEDTSEVETGQTTR